MSDKELIFQAANQFVKNTISNLFKVNTIGVDALITYVMNNMYDKYGIYLDLFTDKENNININLLGNALKDILKNQYDDKYILTIFGKSIKFTSEDVDSFEKIFQNLKSKVK